MYIFNKGFRENTAKISNIIFISQHRQHYNIQHYSLYHLTMEKELLIYLFCHKKNDAFLYKLLYYEEQLILAFVLSHILRHATKLIYVLLN